MRYLIAFFLITSTAFGQANALVSINLPSIAKIDVEPNKNGFTLALTAPTEAGNTVTNTNTNSTKWINFTSAVPTGTTRRISAQLSGAPVSGLNLVMGVSNYSGGGAGTLGNRVPSIILNNSTQTIINNIGGAYTGNGASNGYNLTWECKLNSV